MTGHQQIAAQLAQAQPVFGDYGDYDDANFFGLDAAGRHVGIHYLWGTAFGAAVGTGAAIGWRAFTSGKDKWAELFGLGVAGVPSIVGMFSGKTRAASVVSLLTALGNNGARFLEDILSDKRKLMFAAAQLASDLKKAQDAAKAAGGMTQQQTQQTNTPPVQGVDIQRIPALAGAQLGLVVPQAMHALQGANNPQLLGQGDPRLMHGAMGQHWGATSIGGGRA